MVLLQPLKYLVTFTGGIALSTWVNRRVTRRRERQAKAIGDKRGPASPRLFLDTANAHLATATLKTAVELDVFSQLGAVAQRGEQPTAARLALACSCSDRGMRTLLDALTARGFLTKSTNSKPAYTYWLTPSSAKYLDKASPSYVADAMGWLASDVYFKPIWEELTKAVQQGGAATNAPPIASDQGKQLRWVRFAGSMGGKAEPTAIKVAAAALARGLKRSRILDVGAGHGTYGLALATQRSINAVDSSHSSSVVTALDHAEVLKIAAATAEKNGVVPRRYVQLPGDALDLHWGNNYDAVVLANFLQLHGDADAATLLTKARGALAPGGTAYIVEPIPDEDRTQGEGTVQGIALLALTASGGTRTYSELAELCRAAGFAATELVPLPATAQSLVVAYVDARDSPVERSEQGSREIAARAKELQEVGEDAQKKAAAARLAATSPEETAWNYPMSLSDFFGVVERMVWSSLEVKNPFDQQQ